MRYSVLFAGVAALAASVTAVPHARPHAHAHAKRQTVVTHTVTVTADRAQVTPDNAGEMKVGHAGCNRPDPPGFHGFTPGGFTPCGFTPTVTATGAEIITKANGQKSVSHLEQTLGLSTAAREHPTGDPVAPNSSGGAGDPVSFPKDPSTGGPPTHPFEVLINEPDQPGGRDYPGTILLHTNFHRKNQSSPDVVWGFALQRIAQDMANTCVFQQDLNQQNGGYGQALVAGVPPDQIGRAITDVFYNTQVSHFDGLYGQATPDMSDFANFGFFTQLVWKNTQQMACDTVSCAGKGGLKGKPAGASDDFTVCNFWPAGNVDGEFAENVGPVGDWPTMQWDDQTWAQVQH